VFDAATGTELARLDHDGPVWAVAFAPDGTRVATASADGSARIFDATGTELLRLIPYWGSGVKGGGFGLRGVRAGPSRVKGAAHRCATNAAELAVQ